MLIDKNGITIIDFSHSRRSTSEAAKDSEFDDIVKAFDKVDNR